MNINHPLFDPAEQAALLVAGALPHDEVALLEARLAAGDAFLASEIESYDAVIRELNGNATEVKPDPSIRQSLLDRISRSGPEKRVAADRAGRGPSFPAEVFIRRAQFSHWEEYGVPGMVVDGHDVVAVYRVESEANPHARKGHGPTLIESVHVSPGCPLSKMEDYLAGKGLALPF